MTDHCFAQGVVTTFLAFKNSCDKSEHVLVNYVFLLHSVNLLNTKLDDLRDLFTCVSIDEHDPFVN
jgi:hypothetical protein